MCRLSAYGISCNTKKLKGLIGMAKMLWKNRIGEEKTVNDITFKFVDYVDGKVIIVDSVNHETHQVSRDVWNRGVFKSIMKKQVDKIDPVRSKFGKIQQEEVSLEETMEHLESYASNHKHFSFRNLLEKQCTKAHIVVTFLAILELMKMGKITISQEHIFDDIMIDSNIVV